MTERNGGQLDFVATYAFQPRGDDDVSLEEGDLVLVRVRKEDGWWWGVHWDNGTRGWFPASYVEQASEQSMAAWANRQTDNAGKPSPTFEAARARLEQRHKKFKGSQATVRRFLFKFKHWFSK